MNVIILNSKVRVLYGEHAGKHATVVGIAESGHRDHDLVALDFGPAVQHGAVRIAEHTYQHGIGLYPQAAPVFIFRFALELTEPNVAPAPKSEPRIRRFEYNNLVTVTNTALSKFGQTGRIIHVYSEPVVPDGIGRPSGPFHARYKVEFDYITHRTAELYDWELKFAHPIFRNG